MVLTLWRERIEKESACQHWTSKKYDAIYYRLVI